LLQLSALSIGYLLFSEDILDRVISALELAEKLLQFFNCIVSRRLAFVVVVVVRAAEDRLIMSVTIAAAVLN
jgi:hypothetical protein